MNKLDVQSRIRLKEQLAEMVEIYGVENVKTVLEETADGLSTNRDSSDTSDLNVQGSKKQYVAQTEADKARAASLPQNASTIEDLEQKLNEFPANTQIRENILTLLKDFITNAKLIMSDQHKNVPESFIIGLTTRDLFEANTPEEDWIKYNLDTIRKQLKRKLRPMGYNFLDTFWEVGKKFNSKVHNPVKYENVGNPIENGRILKVLNEGIVINNVLHINANVIVGKYSQEEQYKIQSAPINQKNI